MMFVPRRKYKRILLSVILILATIFIILWRNSNKTKVINPKHFYREKNQEEFIDNHGIKVVIGHYIGNPLDKIPNASLELINSNNFNPVLNAGKNGNPVVLQSKDIVKMQQLFQINKFNLMASDMIPLNRTLPDVRRKRCKTLFKDFKTYPKTSIIIVFHNEAWSTLLRTIWSVIIRSPRELLEEIILVDDNSEREFLKQALDQVISSLPINTRIIRSKNRIGLIKARLLGASTAKGEVLTFLDAHCECTEGWLESLLYVIKNDRTTVVCPVIDIIHDDTFAYIKSFELHWGAFNWNLQFRWYTLGGRELKIRKQDSTQAFSTPAMAGGLFSIDKNYFYEIGSYDENMNVWGGENLEMSFRVWQCGGQIKIAPCSHVGHIFRKSSPYSFPGGITKTLFSNLARVALVWMDDWANFFFKFNLQAKEIASQQNITSRILLRKKLKCNSFEWYLDNIWPQHFFPKKDRFFGRIKNVGKDKCLIKPDRKGITNQPMGVAKIETCLGDHVALEMFVMTQDGFVMTDDSICLDAPEKQGIGPSVVRIMACSGQSRQQWEYNSNSKELKHKSNQQCLDVMKNKDGTDGLTVNDCSGKKNQKWILESVYWK